MPDRTVGHGTPFDFIVFFCEFTSISGDFESKESDFAGFIIKIHISRYVKRYLCQNIHSIV